VAVFAALLMASIFKTLAIAASAGVAVGICTTTANRRAVRITEARRPETRTPESRNDVLDIEPLLDRLETLERRFELAASSVSFAEPSGVQVSELTSRIDAQEAEIERLRSLVDVRAADIEQRLRAEMAERQKQALAGIERTVELKISERISAIERTLTEQSASIETLRERAQDTDVNLKRLIAAIERLCERTQPLQAAATAPPPISIPVPAPAPGPGPNVVPFETHLAEARQKQDERLPDFSQKLFVEPGKETRKPRFPLARLFGMLALVVLTQAFVH